MWKEVPYRSQEQVSATKKEKRKVKKKKNKQANKKQTHTYSHTQTHKHTHEEKKELSFIRDMEAKLSLLCTNKKYQDNWNGFNAKGEDSGLPRKGLICQPGIGDNDQGLP